MRIMLLPPTRTGHRHMSSALVLVAVLGLCGCDQLTLPTAPTAAAPQPLPLPPAPPPTFNLSGVVTDGSAFGGGGGLNTGTVTVLTGDRAGSTASIFTGGSFTLRDLPAGGVTVSVSSVGYRTAERTVFLDNDARLDVSLARTARSPLPSIAGAWAGRIGTRAGLSAVEFTFTQTGNAITATWRAPTQRWSGTLQGTIDGERSVRGRITVNSGCAASGDIGGLLEFEERSLLMGAQFSGSCGPGDIYTFDIFRACRITSSNGLTCG